MDTQPVAAHQVFRSSRYTLATAPVDSDPSAANLKEISPNLQPSRNGLS